MFSVISKIPDIETDDADGLERIMRHINNDHRFEYMQRDGGGLSILSFKKDNLVLTMQGNCGGCTVIKIAGTRRHVQLSLEEDFGEVTVTFQEMALNTAPTPIPDP